MKAKAKKFGTAEIAIFYRQMCGKLGFRRVFGYDTQLNQQ